MNNKENKKLMLEWARRAIYLLLIIAFIYSVFSAGYLSGRSNRGSGQKGDIDFSLFWEAWDEIAKKSVSKPEDKKLLQGSIAGLVESLGDPYTVYLKPEENKRFREDIAGEFGGIGIEIVPKNGLPTVIAPLSGTPAESAGLKPGDVILEVDGAETKEIGFEETVNKIRGEKETIVKLKITRDSLPEPLEFEIKRQVIKVKSVQVEVKNQNNKKIFYIKVRQFGDDTDDLFAEAVKSFQKEKAESIILDLRNDPGGYLESAVNLASYFIDGVIVSEKEKNDKTKEYKALGKQKLKGIKTAVLVNKGSASASEIVAGALQDRAAAEIIGEKTFGKGSVQELFDLSDGSAVKITIANWFTPSGRQITNQGIEPGIVVSDDEKSAADEQLNRALEFLDQGK